MSPHKKSAWGEIITDLICLPLLKYRRLHKKYHHYRIVSPPEKSLPADNLPVKIRPARAAAGRGGFSPVNCRPRETSGEGDPVMGHRPCMLLQLLQTLTREYKLYIVYIICFYRCTQTRNVRENWIPVGMSHYPIMLLCKKCSLCFTQIKSVSCLKNVCYFYLSNNSVKIGQF